MAQSLDEHFKTWKNRVCEGEKRLKNDRCEWDKYVKAYEGEILDADKSDFNEQFATVNLFYVDVRSSVPKLYSQNPYAYIDPETPEADVMAELMEKLVNVQKETKWFLKPRMEEAIKSAKIKGRSYLKTSFKFDGDKIGRAYVGEEPNDECNISFRDRGQIIIDPNASSWLSRRWCADEIYAPIQEIREKFKIKKDEKIAVVEDKDLPESMSAEEKEDFQFGKYWEIEDPINRNLSVIVDGLNRYGVKPYEFPYGFYSMYDALEWNHIPGKLDTKADLHFWYRLLIELCEQKTQQQNHRRKGNSKYIATGQAELTEKQIADLKSYKDGIVVQLPIGTTVSPFQHANLAQDVYLGEQSTRQDITIVSGMNEMKQGLPQSEKTAREAMLIASESSSVVGYISGKVEDVVASVLTKCIWMVQTYYDKTRVISLTGMEEAEYIGFKEKFKDRKGVQVLGTSKRPFVSFVGTELQGKMRVKVKAGSAMPVNEAQRKQDIEQLVALMGQNQQMAAAVDSKELIKEIAKLLHIENKGIILDPKSPEQENALLKRNIPVMPHLNEPHDDHIARHERENNNTPAFIAHLLSHKIMKSFIEGATLQGSQPTPGAPGDLLGQRVSGLPQGSNVPPAGLPQQNQPAPAMRPVAGAGPAKGPLPN